MVEITFDHVMKFAPKVKPGLDNHPAIMTINLTTGKESKGSVKEYMQRFQFQWAWFHLAKFVARFSDYQLPKGFMNKFNNDGYSVCNSAPAYNGVADKVLVLRERRYRDSRRPCRGARLLRRHSEVRSNPLLNIKEGKALLELIRGDVRPSVVTRVEEY